MNREPQPLSSDARRNTPDDLILLPAYSHLLHEERDQIAVMKAAGRSIGAIAGAGRYSQLHAAGAQQLRRRGAYMLAVC